MTTPDVITAEEISSRLHTNWMAENCIYLESVDSTNNYAKRIAEDGTPSGTLVVADEQTGGKGRRGRSWSTPKGSNIAMTLLLRPRFRPGTCIPHDTSGCHGSYLRHLPGDRT